MMKVDGGDEHDGDSYCNGYDDGDVFYVVDDYDVVFDVVDDDDDDVDDDDDKDDDDDDDEEINVDDG